MEHKKPKYKPTMKNTIKTLVKENQRIHDYDSPFGVKFWNSILKRSKRFAHNNKVFEKNIPLAVEEIYNWLEKCYNEAEDLEKKSVFERQLWQLSFFKSDKWKNLVFEGHLREGQREILWKENSKEPDKYEKKKKKECVK